MSTAVTLSYFRTKDFRYPAFLAFCVVGALGLSPLIKVVIQRPRPQFSQVFEIGGFAFPSGHATTSTIVFASLAYVLSRSESWRVAVWIWAASGFAAFLIGFSRLYLGVHWPTDVIGGWVLGLLWVATGVVITNLAWEVTGGPARPDPHLLTRRARPRYE
jgi:undecaprenyl-diphosphatase